MGRERPKTIGVNNGFLTADGKLLLQIRTNNSWMGKVLDKCYEGQWELNDGGFSVKDIEKELTLPFLKEKAIQNAKEKLGVSLVVPESPEMYLTIYKNEEKSMLDWAIMFVIPPACWHMPTQLPRDIMLVDLDGLNERAKQPEGKGQLVSGWGKRQHRMGLCALWRNSNPNLAAYQTLIQFVDYVADIYSSDVEGSLKKLREEIK